MRKSPTSTHVEVAADPTWPSPEGQETVFANVDREGAGEDVHWAGVGADGVVLVLPRGDGTALVVRELVAPPLESTSASSANA